MDLSTESVIFLSFFSWLSPNSAHTADLRIEHLQCYLRHLTPQKGPEMMVVSSPTPQLLPNVAFAGSSMKSSILDMYSVLSTMYIA